MRRLSDLHLRLPLKAASALLSARLLTIFEGVSQVIAEYGPHEAAIEETFMNTNAASALKLGHARAAAMVAPASAGLSVSECAAKVVKKSVVGTGGAEKSQVVFMIRRLLPTAGVTNTDAADAPAVAIAHAHARRAGGAAIPYPRPGWGPGVLRLPDADRRCADCSSDAALLGWGSAPDAQLGRWPSRLAQCHRSRGGRCLSTSRGACLVRTPKRRWLGKRQF